MTHNLIWMAHQRYSEAAQMNLLCFPYAGGSSTFFSPLKMKIIPQINVCPILYPGREKNIGKNGFDTIEEMASVLVKENPEFFTREYALMGHCTGALIAYEVALAAEQEYGRSPKVFFASAAPAPSCPQFFHKDKLSDGELTRQLIHNKMIDKAFAEKDVYTEYYLPLMRRDLEMHTNYSPETPFRKMKTEVKVIFGEEDSLFQDKQTVEDWNLFAEHGVQSMSFPGGHFYINECRSEVAELINQSLGIQ